MMCDFLDRAVPGVRALTPYQPGKPESELRRELGLSEIVKLASNENPLGASQAAVAAARQALDEVGRYPDGNGFELKAALSEYLGVPANRLTLGNGSNDVLELVVRAFVSPGDEVVYSKHSFAVYALASQAVGATARVAPALREDATQPYGHDLVSMASLVGEATKVVFVANPNNPTGTWLGSAELLGFLDRLPSNVIAVVDEAYAEYVVVSDYDSLIDQVDRFPNLVVTRTFSKAFGLAGLRVGYAVSNPQVAELMNRVRQPFNVNSAALAAAKAALGDTDHIRESRELNTRQMSRLQAELSDLGLGILPSAANFLCVDTHQDAFRVFQALLSGGVIVRPIANYGLDRHLRITIGTPRENDRLIHVLRQVLG